MLITTARASGTHKRGYASRTDLQQTGEVTRLEAEPGVAHGL